VPGVLRESPGGPEVGSAVLGAPSVGASYRAATIGSSCLTRVLPFTPFLRHLQFPSISRLLLRQGGAITDSNKVNRIHELLAHSSRSQPPVVGQRLLKGYELPAFRLAGAG
jgi:hypothetical protein